MTRRSAHFVVNTLGMNKGGLVKAVRQRANALAAEPELNIQIDVLAPQPDLDAVVALMKQRGQLASGVKVVRVLDWLDLHRDREEQPLLGCPHGFRVKASERSPGAYTYTYRGKPFAMGQMRGSHLARLRILWPGTDVRCATFEAGVDGKVRRIMLYGEDGGQPTDQILMGGDGAPFLWIRHRPGSRTWIEATLLGPTPQVFESMGDLYVEAFERLFASEAEPVVVSEFRESLGNFPDDGLDSILLRVKHPTLKRVGMLHSSHLSPPYDDPAKVGGITRRLLDSVEDFDAVVALTEAQRTHIIEQFGGECKVRAIPHAVVDRFEKRVGTRSKRIITVARVHPKKRLDEAIRVMRLVVDEEPEARLEIFGSDVPQSRAPLMDLIKELSLQKSVSFRPFQADIGTVYAGAVALLSTSASEGFGMAVLEAQTAGIPVVSYDSNYGPRDILDDGVTGFLVPFGDQKTAAARLVELIRDEDTWQSMSHAGIQRSQAFDLARFTSQWKELLLNC